MKICYVEKTFQAKTRALIDQANSIIDEYAADGYSLTLRQLHYQFVARDLVPNSQKSYNRLGSVVNDARLAGLVDWYAIEDRTRNLKSLSHWDNPEAIIAACASQFRLDRWAKQPTRVEVWIEKEALAGVFDRVCSRLDVPLFACRGYVSQSELWRAARRMIRYRDAYDQDCHILHFGDHDPSGIDMTRDIRDRFATFGADVEVHRIALNADQIEEYNPPPNPAKMTDSRFASYLTEHGDQSWELDALEPKVLAALVESEVEALRDPEAWDASAEVEDGHRMDLRLVEENWQDAVYFVRDRVEEV